MNAQSADHGTILSVQGVHKRFGDRPVLQGINLDVDRHEVVALIASVVADRLSDMAADD